VRTGRELSEMLTQLALSLPALKGDDLKAAKRLLARSTDGISDRIEQGYASPRRHRSAASTSVSTT
jgi:hypothetical protein